MQRESAPAGADLHQPLAGLQGELAAHRVELGQRRLVQRRMRGLEDAAGIRHRLVEEQAEEVVAEVVVSGDVAPAALRAVVVEPVQDAPQRRADDRQTGIHGVHPVAVDHHDAHQRGQVVAGPVAPDVGLAGADRPAEGGVRPELRLPDLDRRGQVAARGAPAEDALLAVLDDAQFAFRQAREMAEHRLAAEPLDGAGRKTPGAARGRDDGRLHRGSLVVSMFAAVSFAG